MAELAPLPSLERVTIQTAPRGIAFGSIVIAMLIGAFFTVSGLYLWGAELAKSRGASFGGAPNSQEAGLLSR